MVVPALAREDACRTGKVAGSYTRTQSNVDVFGDGSVIHTFIFQLNVHSDGTADEYWTGYPDYMINTGTNSTSYGSWTCRQNGTMVVTLIQAGYTPILTSANAPNPDVELALYSRTTELFSIVDSNTIQRTQARTRRYGPNQDPADPAGGLLRPLNTTVAEYKRLQASDADLLLP